MASRAMARARGGHGDGRGQAARSGINRLNERARNASRPRGHRCGGRGRDQPTHGGRGLQIPTVEQEAQGGTGKGGGDGRGAAGLGRGGTGGNQNGDGGEQARRQKPREVAAPGVESSKAQHDRQDMEEPARKKKKELTCTICSDDHFTNNCPLLQGPKPYAALCGLVGDGLGFFHIRTDGAKPAAPPERMMATALFRIVEGGVSAELLKAELARILPVKWDWTVHEHKEKGIHCSFSKVELGMLVAIKRIPTDNNEGVLYFEEWNQEINPKRKLHRVWVLVYGIPYEIRSFLTQ